MVPRTGVSGLVSSLTEDSSLGRNDMTSVVAARSSERSSKSSTMSPRVTISPLRSSDVLRPSKKPVTGTEGRGRSSATLDKSKVLDKSLVKSRSVAGSIRPSGTAGQCRSRNIQLTSLFDSLSGFFSADSERRRRAAYVNATVSLAQSSLNPRHCFTSPPTVTPPPAPTKSRQATDKSRPGSQRKPAAPKSRGVNLPQPMARKKPARHAPAMTARTDVKLPRIKKRTVKRETKCDSVDDKTTSSRDTVDGAEMKELMASSVAEAESKLFHTAQTIAQQVITFVCVISECNAYVYLHCSL